MRWVLPEAKVPGLMRDLKNRDTIIAKLATLERDWTTYIPSPPSIEMSTPILTIDLVMLRVFGLKYSIMLYDNVTFFTACIVVRINFAVVSCYLHGRPFIWFTTSGYPKQSTEHNFTNNTLIPDILDSDCVWERSASFGEV